MLVVVTEAAQLDAPMPVAPAIATVEAPLIEPEGLTFSQAAAYIGVSRSKLYQFHDAGLCPAPVSLGDGDGCKRFSRSELRAWLIAGAPPRLRWAGMREAAIRRLG